MMCLKQCLQALPISPFSLPDPTQRPPAFLILHRQRAWNRLTCVKPRNHPGQEQCLSIALAVWLSFTSNNLIQILVFEWLSRELLHFSSYIVIILSRLICGSIVWHILVNYWAIKIDNMTICWVISMINYWYSTLYVHVISNPWVLTSL